MTSDMAVLLLLLLALQLKHLAADYLLQTDYVLANRRHYGHPGGLLHVALHGIGSILVFLIFPTPWVALLLIVAAELIAHYHIDWAKDGLMHRFGWSAKDRGFWVAAGTDQALHQATYLGMALAWAWVTMEGAPQ